jgi:hypothetical protein
MKALAVPAPAVARTSYAPCFVTAKLSEADQFVPDVVVDVFVTAMPSGAYTTMLTPDPSERPAIVTVTLRVRAEHRGEKLSINMYVPAV